MASPSNTDAKSSNLLAWLAGAAVLALLAAIFSGAALELWSAWQSDPNYSHGPLVLPLSLLFAWLYLRNHPPEPHADALAGSLSIVAGGLLHGVSLLFASLWADYLALVLILRGLAIAVGGKRWAAGLWFPILFLFFMFPLPFFVTNHLAVQLQNVVSAASAVILDVLVGCTQRGNELTLASMPRTPLKVGQECSGVRQAVAFFALATVLAYGALRSWGWGLLLVALAVPIAIITNILRVLLMALGILWFGPGWSASSLHDVPALLTMPIGLLLFFGCVKMMERSSTPPTQDPP